LIQNKLRRFSFTGYHRGFADSDTKTGGQVYLGAILNNPAGLLEVEINLLLNFLQVQ
jgi:hypothetical protein